MRPSQLLKGPLHELMLDIAVFCAAAVETARLERMDAMRSRSYHAR